MMNVYKYFGSISTHFQPNMKLKNLIQWNSSFTKKKTPNFGNYMIQHCRPFTQMNHRTDEIVNYIFSLKR
jgi:hypothetical protein